MGKRIITQRRGRGTPRYRAPSHRYKYSLKYPQTDDILIGRVVRIIKDQARNCPLAVLKFSNNEEIIIPAPVRVREGSIIHYNDEKSLTPGSILELAKIPEGMEIFNIENRPKENSSFCRSAGNTARIVLKTDEYILIQLPSKKSRKFNPRCRATIGVIAGSGFKEKPMLKAGKMFHRMKSKSRLWPKTSGVAMNAVDHPFGSGRGRHVGKPKTPKKNSPPGRNIGLIRARRTGRKK